MIFGKQKFDMKQLEYEQFMFNFKHLKMNKFIKYIWQLIISTSNTTLVVPSLRPWVKLAAGGQPPSAVKNIISKLSEF